MSWFNINVPQDIKVMTGDAVSLKIISPNSKTDATGACYYMCMSKLSEFTFDCFPYHHRVSILDQERFMMWVQYFMSNGLISSKNEPYIDGNKNCMKVHGKDESKHRVYAALCCYRWSECLAPMCYEAVELMKKKPDLDFYRVLHFLSGKYVQNYNHSFTIVSNYGAYSSPGFLAPKLDLMWGLAPKWFFQNKKYKKADQKMTTQGAIKLHINGQLPVEKHEDLMDDKWAALFEAKPKDAKKVYDELTKTSLDKAPLVC